MSAYIISKETMHRVVAAVVDYLSTSHGPHNVTAEGMQALTEFLPHGFTVHAQRIAYGRALYKMNAEAVNARYSHNQDALDAMLPEAEHYTGRFVAPTDMEKFKAMTCFLYQCSEGNVPEENPLFALCQTVKHDIADDIVKSLPSWNLSKGWDDFEPDEDTPEQIPLTEMTG